MEILNQIVGIVAGLVAIFAFITGIDSIAHLRGARRVARLAPSTGSAALKPALLRLLLLVPVFGVSIAVTATAGLSGSDTGGIVCLLLIAAALAVFGFHWFGLGKLVPLIVYGPVVAVILAGLGLTFGTIGRGEEGFGVSVGIAIGAGSWLITALTSRSRQLLSSSSSPQGPGAAPEYAADASDEKTVLQIAAKQDGLLRVTDVALNSEIGLDKATNILESLCKRSYCRKTIQESGAIEYEFPDLKPR
jgi:hypothetical protein